MKKIYQIYILILFCCNFAKAQIIEFENEIILNVPDKFIYVENDLNSEMMSDLVDFLGDNNKSYLIGTKDSVEFTREYQNDPEALMEPINQKMNRKNFQSETSMINFMIKELKSMMKKRNYESVIWLIISNESIRDTNKDLYQFANEVKTMDNRTLKKELVSYQKEWKSYVSNLTSGLNKYLKVSKLVVENNNQIPSAEFSISYNIKGFKGKMNFYGFIKNDKITMLVYECLNVCPKKFASIENIVSPTFSNIKLENKKNNDIVSQLKELNDLYNSGALTKEEFEKAKKKIINKNKKE